MEKLKQIIAYVAKKKGRRMKEEDFVNVLSYDRSWIPPQSARRLFKVCVDANLLVEREGYYEPSFEIKGFILPLDFQVGEEDVKDYFVEQDVFTQLLDHICSKTGKERRDVLMELNRIKNDMRYISIEVAALIYCKENSIDCSQFYGQVEEKIKNL